MKQKALVLLNMGGPNNLDEVKLFLSNMFNDKNIITVKSSLLRRFIAVMITTSRTKKAQANQCADRLQRMVNHRGGICNKGIKFE